MTIHLTSHPITIPVHAMYIAMNTRLMLRRMPLPNPLNNRINITSADYIYIFRLSTHVQWTQGSYLGACRFLARFISPQLSTHLQISTPVSFPFCSTPGSLGYFPPTVVFIVPSHQTHALHMICRQSLPLLAHDEPYFWEGTLWYCARCLSTQPTSRQICNFSMA